MHQPESGEHRRSPTSFWMLRDRLGDGPLTAHSSYDTHQFDEALQVDADQRHLPLLLRPLIQLEHLLIQATRQLHRGEGDATSMQQRQSSNQNVEHGLLDQCRQGRGGEESGQAGQGRQEGGDPVQGGGVGSELGRG